jgi:hypothetical protein
MNSIYTRPNLYEYLHKPTGLYYLLYKVSYNDLCPRGNEFKTKIQKHEGQYCDTLFGINPQTYAMWQGR